MTAGRHGELVTFIQDHVGDALLMVIRFTETESHMIRGAEWFETHLSEADTRTPDQMHQDAVSRLQEATLAGNLYDTDVRSEIRVTDDGIGVYLFASDREGFFVWLDPDADVQIPAFTDECLAQLDAE